MTRREAVKDALELAADQLGPYSLLKALAKALGLTGLDVDALAAQWRTAELSRLFGLIQQAEARACTPEEAFEICLQTTANFQYTVNLNKRRRMTNVAVNGISDPERIPLEHRLFIRAVAQLEVEHIDALRELQGKLPATRASSRVLLGELARWGLVTEVTDVRLTHLPNTAVAEGGPQPRVESRTKYEQSQFGHRFLTYLRDPSDES